MSWKSSRLWKSLPVWRREPWPAKTYRQPSSGLCSQLRYKKVLFPTTYGVYYQNIPYICWEKLDKSLHFAVRLPLPKVTSESPTFKHLIWTPEIRCLITLDFPTRLWHWWAARVGTIPTGVPADPWMPFSGFQEGLSCISLSLPGAHLCLTTFRAELIPAMRLSSIVLARSRKFCSHHKLLLTCSSSWSNTWVPFQTGVRVL